MAPQTPRVIDDRAFDLGTNAESVTVDHHNGGDPGGDIGYNFRGFNAGLGGTYFFEPGTQIGLVSGTVGYGFTPNIGVELQVDIGLTKEKFDNGSTFRSSTGISWAAIPFFIVKLPIGGSASHPTSESDQESINREVDLFFRGGYGATRFSSTTEAFALLAGVSRSTGVNSSSNTVGTAALGGGAEIPIDRDDRIRVNFDHLWFDNGSNANRVGIIYIHSFGHP